MKKQKSENQPAAHRMLRNIIGRAMALAMTVTLGGGMAAAQAAQKTENDSLRGLAAQPAEYFYTGKPYDADTESYTFRYRNYDPELNRWTTADPSGFPDGVNNQLYAPNPFSEFDFQGLDTMTVTASWTVPRTESYYSNGTLLTITYTAHVTRDIIVDYTATETSVTMNSIELAPLPGFQLDGFSGSLYFVSFALGSPELTYTPTAGFTPEGNAKLTVAWSLKEHSSITFSPSKGPGSVDTHTWGWATPLDSGSFDLFE